MAKSINSLLNKKGWTGLEVGKLLFTSLIHDVSNHTKPDYKPLFKQEDFDRICNSMKSDNDWVYYGVYLDLYNSVLDAYNAGNAYFQQFYNGYGRYSNIIMLSHQSENAISTTDKYPLIVTREQYNRLKEETAAHLKSCTDTVGSLILYSLQAFIEGTTKAPKAIQKAIEATKAEPVTNSRILSSYNKFYGRGYYILPNGTRSDQTTEEEWQEAMEADFLSTHKIYYNGVPATPEQTLLHYRTENLQKAYNLIYEGEGAVESLYKQVKGEELPEELAADKSLLILALEEMAGIKGDYWDYTRKRKSAPYYPLIDLMHELIGDTPGLNAKWHYYPEPPALTKYDILAECLDFYNTDETDLPDSELLEEFKTDYPELFVLLEDYVKKSVPSLKEVQPEDYFTKEVTSEELAAADFLDFKSFIVPDKYTILSQYQNNHIGSTNQQRRILTGIAILEEPEPIQVDENGDYIAPDTTNLITSFWSIDKLDEKTLSDCTAYREKLLKPALKKLYSYNKLIEIIGNVYDIENIGAIKQSLDTIEEQVKSLDRLVALFCAKVYGDAEEKAVKRQAIREAFPLINIDSLKPTEAAVQQVREELISLGITRKARTKLKNFDRYIDILTGKEV